MFPSWRYHRTEEPRLIEDPAEHDALGPDWASTPAAFFEREDEEPEDDEETPILTAPPAPPAKKKRTTRKKTNHANSRI